jgi:hypothetical protein
MNRLRFTAPSVTFSLVLACLAATGPARAVESTAEMAARYHDERSICMSPQFVGDRKNCLLETVRASAEIRRNGPADLPPPYAQNALRRCDAHRGDDRVACLARMHGAGTTSGSVAGGGIYRELVTIEPAPAAGHAPAQTP